MHLESWDVILLFAHTNSDKCLKNKPAKDTTIDEMMVSLESLSP